jgi:hypothetical protein
LVACVALPLVGMRVVRVQLGVGGVAGSISHAKLARVQKLHSSFQSGRAWRAWGRSEAQVLDLACAESNDRRERNWISDVESKVVMQSSRDD